MSRYAARTDKTQGAIVRALRGIGCSVLSLARVGGGVPDLLVWHPRSGYLLMEAKSPRALRKDGTLGLSDRVTLDRQAEWRAKWRGPVVVAATPEAAVEAMRWFPDPDIGGGPLKG